MPRAIGSELLEPHSAQDPSYRAVCVNPACRAASIPMQAVTPEPQLKIS